MLAEIAQEATTHDQAVIQLLGLVITGLASVVVALIANRGGRRVDARSLKLAESSNGDVGGNGSAASWRDLAHEWEDRYREESVAHDRTKARLERYEASQTGGDVHGGWQDVVGRGSGGPGSDRPGSDRPGSDRPDSPPGSAGQ